MGGLPRLDDGLMPEQVERIEAAQDALVLATGSMRCFGYGLSDGRSGPPEPVVVLPLREYERLVEGMADLGQLKRLARKLAG